jgi:hypothetical protein
VNIVVAAATGTAASAAIMYLVVNPFLTQAGGLFEVAAATSKDLKKTMADWNKLDEAGQNAVKMQLQGRLTLLEKQVAELNSALSKQSKSSTKTTEPVPDAAKPGAQKAGK